MLPSKLAKRGSLLVFVPIVAFYLYGLGHLPLVGPDEPRYVEVAREMLLNRDLITPTLGGHIWFEKPVLLYWMIDGAFAVFGVSEWAARLGPALCGVLTIVAVYFGGKRIAAHSDDPEVRNLGLWSALLLASTPGLIVFSRGASFDVVVTMTLAWSLVFFLLAELETDTRKRMWLLVGFYVFVGISLLAKGLVGIVIPGGVIFVYHLLRTSFPKKWFASSMTWGVPLALAVSAIWYGPVIYRNGWPFIDQFFIQQHFARYLSNKYHHPQPIYYYLLVIFPLALPWLGFTIQGLIKSNNWAWKGDSAVDRMRVFCFSWILAPLVFFSFSGSKLPGYILPIIPAIALLAGERLVRIMARRTASTIMIVIGSILIVCGLVIVGYDIRSGLISEECAALLATPLIVAGLITLLFRHRTRVAALSMIVAVPISFLVSLNCGIPALSQSYSSKNLIVAANTLGYGSEPVYALHEIDRTAEFYAAGRLVYDTNGEPLRLEGATEVLELAQQRNTAVLVLVPVKYVGQLTSLQSADVQVIADNQVMAIVRVKAKDNPTPNL